MKSSIVNSLQTLLITPAERQAIVKWKRVQSRHGSDIKKRQSSRWKSRVGGNWKDNPRAEAKWRHYVLSPCQVCLTVTLKFSRWLSGNSVVCCKTMQLYSLQVFEWSANSSCLSFNLQLQAVILVQVGPRSERKWKETMAFQISDAAAPMLLVRKQYTKLRMLQEPKQRKW